MKIKYVWYDQPRVEKVFDTERDFNTMPYVFKKHVTQEEYDKWHLRNFAERKERVLVLTYEVVANE